MSEIQNSDFQIMDTVDEPIKFVKLAKEAERKDWISEQKHTDLIQYLIFLACVLVCCLLFVKFVAIRSIVDGHSMNPTLQDRDNLIVEKVSYYISAPERYDIIVFSLPDRKRIHYVKRIIGLPGETVQIKDGYVYINGALLDSDIYGNALIQNAYTAAEPITLGEDEYFCMGDNRNDSRDSRSAGVGPVKKSQIIGRAFFRFWPFNSICKLVHR